jgi:CDP-glucose 4,6-dehydratase
MAKWASALESMVAAANSFWLGKRVLITGHTGFKGSWLSLWLAQMGARVQGLALDPPTQPSCFDVARVGSYITSQIGDIRDQNTVLEVFRRHDPEIVFHLAAQSLVRESYRDPTGTYLTNVMGTVNVLEGVRQTDSVRVAIVITSDKCYDNRETRSSYRETDPMGGHDPYSSSKGCAELVSAAYRRSFFERTAGRPVRLATARAGNVIGGGDWAKDRLVPDCMRALERRETIVIRRPNAVRPWQHVLEPLAGYLVLAEKLWDCKGPLGSSYNFGPCDAEVQPVASVVTKLINLWGNGNWVAQPCADLHEATLLSLDSTLAHNELGWKSLMSFMTALEWTVEWFRAYLGGSTMDEVTLEQIARYQELGSQVEQKSQSAKAGID